jgi:HTH-type transcriptional regulator / antitoxin HigA
MTPPDVVRRHPAEQVETIRAIPQISNTMGTVSPLSTIRNEREYDLAVERLDILLDQIYTNEQHPLYTLLDTLGIMPHGFEEQHHPIPECHGADVFRFLMEEHCLTQWGLPEIASQNVASKKSS